ncbi:MAG: LssY C-terminal domain-containing protein [Nocardioidaceae bacterium]
MPTKVHDDPLTHASRVRPYDRLFFGLGSVAAVWLIVAVVRAGLRLSWWNVLLVVVFWLLLTYLALPRLNRILTAIYVPDYFIGRSRTSDGLLGDPLNLAILGSGEQLATAMVAAGWTPADPVTLLSSWWIIRCTLLHRSYPRAPVSPLYLFNRQQDAAYQQQVEGNPGQRHHIRFWRTPEGWPLPGGHRVDWLAGGTYDEKVGLSLFTLQVTHKVDANIDVERDHVLTTLRNAHPKLPVDVLNDFTSSYHARNGGGDRVETDGNLPVVDLRGVSPVAAAGSLQPRDTGQSMPLQIWFSVLVCLVAAPTLVVRMLRHWPGPGLDLVLAIGAVAALVALFVLSAFVLRRLNLARRVMLAVAAVLVAVQVVDYQRVSDAPGHLHALLSAGVGVLLLVALSSPASTAWAEHSRVTPPQ